MLFQSRKTEFIIIFLFFTFIILVLSLSGYTFLGIQDEVQLQSTLRAGDPRNYMMSYPLSVLVSFLYIKVPAIPWYSIVMLLYIWLISLLMTIYIVKFDYSKYLKLMMLLLFTLLLIFILFEVSVTLLTLLLIAFLVPLIQNHQIFFWFFLYLASFLRVEIILSIAPLIILTYFISIRKTSFNKNKILVMMLFIIAISINHLSSSLDKEYTEWLQFTKHRLYFTDHSGSDNKHILTDDEFHLASSWWISDLDLYPTDKIVQAAGSTFDIVQEKVFKIKNIRRALSKLYHDKMLMVLFLLTVYIILYLEKNNLRRSYYLLFVIGFFFLIFVKDTQRTTFPLMLMWSVLLFLELLKKHKKMLLNFYLFIIILFIAIEIPWTKVIYYHENEQLVKEFKGLVNRNSHMKLETPSGFTSTWKLTRVVLKQNHLLYEKEGLNYNHNLVLAQWFTMHPLFFMQHDISFKEIKRKYNSYYEYLLDENTGTIGSKGKIGLEPFLENNLLRMYDERFLTKTGCHHQIKVADQSEHFVINQIVKKCVQGTDENIQDIFR